MDNNLPPGEQETDVVKFVKAEGLTVEIVPRHLKVIQVSEHDIDSLASGGADISIAFFGICFGALVAFWLVLDAGGVTDPAKHAMYVMLTWASGILTAFFGAQTGRAMVSHGKRVAELKSGKVIK